MDKVFYHKTSNSIFVGDIYDTSWHPTFYAGGVSGFNQAIDEILKLGNDESIIVPGHGKPTGKTELRVFRDNTLNWVSRVKELKEGGLAVSEMKDDAQIKNILHKFNLENKTDFIPEKAVIRFIERTIAVIEKGV
jgi:cyclase